MLPTDHLCLVATSYASSSIWKGRCTAHAQWCIWCGGHLMLLQLQRYDVRHCLATVAIMHYAGSHDTSQTCLLWYCIRAPSNYKSAILYMYTAHFIHRHNPRHWTIDTSFTVTHSTGQAGGCATLSTRSSQTRCTCPVCYTQCVNPHHGNSGFNNRFDHQIPVGRQGGRCR